MERNYKKIPSSSGKVILLILIFLIIQGCQKKETELLPKTHEEKLSKFSFEQLSDKIHLEIKGESAEISPDRKKSFIKEPFFSLSSKEETIEISTDSEGKAEITIDPESQQIQEVPLKGEIDILQKDIKNNKVLMNAHCKKLTYVESEKLFTMEGNPVIKRNKSSFSGEKILYYWDKNKIEIKGKVNVLIYPEKSSAN